MRRRVEAQKSLNLYIFFTVFEVRDKKMQAAHTNSAGLTTAIPTSGGPSIHSLNSDELASQNTGSIKHVSSDLSEALILIATLVLPPLGVFCRFGLGNKQFWFNLALTLLGFFPGLLHGVWLQSQHQTELD